MPLAGIGLAMQIVKRSRLQSQSVEAMNRPGRGNMPGIHSQAVTLIEGDAGEIVPNARLAANMHGFVIMVPHGDDHEWFLDLLWRITMLYAGRPNWLRSRAKMSQMVAAVMSKENRGSRPGSHPILKSGSAAPPKRNESTAQGALLDRLKRQPAINADSWKREELYERKSKSGGKKQSTRKEEQSRRNVTT